MSILGDVVKIGSLGLIDLDEPAEKAEEEARRQAGELRQAGQTQAEATLEVARRAEDLNRERYDEAKSYLMPRIGQSDIAQRQLMAEMGLPDYYGEQNRDARNAPRAAELQKIVDAGYGDRPGDGEDSGVWEDERDAWFGAKRELYDMRLEREQGGNIPGGNVSYDAPGGQRYAPTRSYMDVPGYQDAIDESLRTAEQSAVSSGSTAYGGRRLKAAGKVGAGVQQSYYNNYMNILQNMASPQVAQNMASLGVGQGAQIGAQNIGAQNTASNIQMSTLGGSQDLLRQATNIPMAQQADQMSMLTNIGTAFI